MKDYLNDIEWIESLNLVENIKNEVLADELVALSDRELEMLKNVDNDEDLRTVLVYNISILTAAAARIRCLPPKSNSSEPK